MDGKSLTPQEIKLKQLQEILPEAFSEGKIDFEKLKATLGDDINFSNERYVLNWAGKSEAFKVLQSPTAKTLIPAKDDSLNFDETENIFIEGENLEVLKVLQKSYFGKVKMIYIDPPYNTGNDSFIYPDKFSETKAEYEKRVGDKDEEGYMTKDGMFRKNSKENGQYHSNWLNMMYPRLFVAKNLLKANGVIFISIDDNEVHNLRLLLNEVFGEENFIAQFIWKRRQNVDSRAKNGVSTDHEYILVYRKTEIATIRGADKDMTKYSNPDNDKRGNWMSADMTGLATKEQRPNLHYDLVDPETKIVYSCPPTGWRYEPKRMKELIGNGEVLFPKSPDGRPRRKKFQKDLESEFTGFSSMLDTVFNTQGTREVRALFNDKEYFDFPKPKDLLKLLIKQGTSVNEADIVLDFFSGSATLAHATMDLNIEDEGNRKYICVQLPEKCDEKSEAYKAGFNSIADIAKERIRKVSINILSERKRLGLKVKELQVSIDDLQNQIEEHKRKAAPELFSDKQEMAVVERLKIKQEYLQEDIIKCQNKVSNIDQCDKGFKVLKLTESNFKQWQQIKGNDADALVEQMKLFVDPVSEKATTENMVYELLLKSGKDINCRIEYKEDFCCVNDTELVLILQRVTQEIVSSILKINPQKVIALDRLFKGNDQLKTNTVLQMKDAGIEFKTI
jgi:adenine-specific DNA-methyltransferase